MYSAVLMLALTAGSETADFGRHGCSGAYGCSGYSAPVVSSCHGGGGMFAHHHRDRGCHGGGYGCSASSYGCASSSCHGGGLFGHRHQGHGCSASSYGCTSSYYGGTVGCYGGAGCSRGVVVPTGDMRMQGDMKMMPKSEPVPPPTDKKKVQAAAPATILVSLPAGARLTIDGAATTSTAAQRTLVTPALEVGADYVYTFRAEFVSEGRTQIQTQQVNVRGGQTTTVQFSVPTQAVASR